MRFSQALRTYETYLDIKMLTIPPEEFFASKAYKQNPIFDSHN